MLIAITQVSNLSSEKYAHETLRTCVCCWSFSWLFIIIMKLIIAFVNGKVDIIAFGKQNKFGENWLVLQLILSLYTTL